MLLTSELALLSFFLGVDDGAAVIDYIWLLEILLPSSRLFPSLFFKINLPETKITSVIITEEHRKNPIEFSEISQDLTRNVRFTNVISFYDEN